MHAWCPDAYEGAPTPITAFLSVAPKAAGFAVLMRVFSAAGDGFNWPLIIAVISAATMTFGNLAAIPQTNVKRLLAYSSIAHAGYLLMGVASGTPRGAEAVYFYFAAYLVMNLGAFLVVQIIANTSPPLMGGDIGEGGRESLAAYKGLGRRGASGAILGITMTIFLLSLTGIPPFVGFIGKFYIFAAVMDAKLYWLAFIGIANSVVSLYYYMRIVKTIFFDEPADAVQPAFSSRRLAAILGVLSFATIFIGLYWQWLSNIVAAVIA
ncbi:MAG: NADH-quinone oxidoreductase subunit N [Deltaproteobacteria bacterium]|nr:NADH-quinone oxidoreductase subunit N [Deltaproteobacteria bacterium]